MAITRLNSLALGSDAIPNPNLVINGSMQIGQRSALTGQSGTNSAYGGVDRWMSELRNVGTYSVSQSTSVVPEGFSHSLEVKCTTADASLDANSYGHLTYKFEGQDVQVFKKGTSSAIPFALSFWVRSSKTGTYVVRIRDNTNARYFSKNYTISSANTWEYKTVIFAADTTGAITANTSSGMSLYFWFSGGTDYTSGSAMTDWSTTGTLAPSQVNLSDTVNATFYLTGVKLEASAACTAFEMPDYATELAKCQRYYSLNKGSSYLGGFWPYGATLGLYVRWTQTMRAAPTVAAVSTRNGSTGAVADSTPNYIGVDGCNVTITASGSSGNFMHINSQQLPADAEL